MKILCKILKKYISSCLRSRGVGDGGEGGEGIVIARYITPGNASRFCQGEAYII